MDTNLQYKPNVKYFSVKKIKQDVLNQINDIDSMYLITSIPRHKGIFLDVQSLIPV